MSSSSSCDETFAEQGMHRANRTSKLISKRFNVNEDLLAAANRGDKPKASIVFPVCKFAAQTHRNSFNRTEDI